MVSAGWAFLAAATIVLLAGDPFIKWLGRVGRQNAPREDTPATHLRKAGTPSLGGLFLIPSIALAAVAAAPLDPTARGFAVAVIAFAALGAADDVLKARRPSRRGLLARTKLAGQVVLAAGVAAYAHATLAAPEQVHLLPGWPALTLGPVWAAVLRVLVIVWLANAANITDGLDGLAAGLTVTAAAGLVGGTVLYGVVPTAAAALAGGCLGFLWYNRYPARVWMGDTGSLGLGAGIATLGVLSGQEWLALVAALPLTIELLSVVLQVVYFQATKRLLGLAEGRRIFRRSPLHHHFEECGAAEPAIVVGFWAAGLLCAAMAVGLVALERGLPGWTAPL